MTALPNPPLGAHSSFATRSSLFLVERSRLVTCLPRVSSVYGGDYERGGSSINATIEAHLEAVHDTVGVEERRGAGILRGPLEDVAGGGVGVEGLHCQTSRE